MTFDEYQKTSRQTALYPAILGKNFVYPTLGLVGEAGEIAEKVKKVFRDNNGEMSEERRAIIAGELGDVLWYLAQIATELDLSLDTIAAENINKLLSRKERGVLHGDGDNR